jgi:hypothetical protein
MLATMLPPSSGRTVIAGYDVVRTPAAVRAHIGYVPQLGAVTERAPKMNIASPCRAEGSECVPDPADLLTRRRFVGIVFWIRK